MSTELTKYGTKQLKKLKKIRKKVKLFQYPNRRKYFRPLLDFLTNIIRLVELNETHKALDYYQKEFPEIQGTYQNFTVSLTKKGPKMDGVTFFELLEIPTIIRKISYGSYF
ncbi:MAG: hypothetical protein ACFE8P_12960 [Promethearchaeota archaeon]